MTDALVNSQTQNPMPRTNIVFVGKKAAMAYVLAVVGRFNEGQGTVQIKARGKAISRAVDVAEIVRNKFLKDVQINAIQISTEEMESKTKEPLNVSTIEITLQKQA